MSEQQTYRPWTRLEVDRLNRDEWRFVGVGADGERVRIAPGLLTESEARALADAYNLAPTPPGDRQPPAVPGVDVETAAHATAVEVLRAIQAVPGVALSVAAANLALIAVDDIIAAAIRRGRER